MQSASVYILAIQRENGAIGKPVLVSCDLQVISPPRKKVTFCLKSMLNIELRLVDRAVLSLDRESMRFYCVWPADLL